MASADGRKYKVRAPVQHDFTSEPVLEGQIVQTGTMKIDGEDRDFMVVVSATSLSQVFRSTGLAEAFDASDVGDFVRLEYKGTKDLGGGRTFKRYSVAVWS